MTNRNYFYHLNPAFQLIIIPLLLTSCNLGSGDVWTDPPVPVSSFKSFVIDYNFGDINGYVERRNYKGTGNLESRMSYSGAGADGKWMTSDDTFNYGYFYIYDDQGKAAYFLNLLDPGVDGKWLTGDDQISTSRSIVYEEDSDTIIGYVDNLGMGADGIWVSGDEPIFLYYVLMDDPVVPNQKLTVQYNAGGDSDWFTPDDTPGAYIRDSVNGLGNLQYSSFHNNPGVDGIWLNDDDPSFNYFGYRYDGLNRLQYKIRFDVGPDNIPGNTDDFIVPNVDETKYLTNGKIGSYTIYTNEGIDTDWLSPDDVAFSSIQYIYNGQDNLIRTNLYIDGGDGIMPNADDTLSSYQLYTYGENNILTLVQHYTNSDLLFRDEIYKYIYEKDEVTVSGGITLF